MENKIQIERLTILTNLYKMNKNSLLFFMNKNVQMYIYFNMRLIAYLSPNIKFKPIPELPSNPIAYFL